MADSKRGRVKKPRGKVTHVLFDQNNAKHVKDFEKLSDTGGDKEGKLLQYYEEKLVGYVDFSIEKNAVDIEHIHLESEYRDTLPIADKRKSDEIFEEVKSIYKKHNAESLSDIKDKRDLLRLRSLRREQGGLKKRENQLFLGAKMIRHLAKTYGKPVESAFARTSGGQKMMDVYMSKYHDPQFFKRRGAQRPRKRRKR